jgi:hypothetical protein
MKRYKVNEAIAGIVPMAVGSEQLALNEDIKMNGQNQPIVLWRNEIVDGRCRQIACEYAGIEVKAESLDWDMSVDEVIAKVKSLNTRRNLTLTQKAMVAARDGSTNMHELARKWGISVDSLKRAKYIAKHRPDYEKLLFDGEMVYLSNGKRTNALKTIATAVRADLESGVLVLDSETHFESAINTEAGKKWYAENIDMIRAKPEMFAVELANLKYRLKDIDGDC